jgi:hypothetical protein
VNDLIGDNTLIDFNDDPDNPFSPGFGISPPELAGRSDTTGQIYRAFDAGPRDDWFVATVIGDRGVGKTALLNEVERYARALGWTVVHEQAVADEALLGLLLADLVHEVGSRWSRAKKVLGGFDIEASLGVNVAVVSAGVKAKAKSLPGRDAPTRLARDVLRAVGDAASKGGSGVLLTIDEAHSWTREAELRALAAALQIVVKREGLPVAVIFAGLPVTREILERAGTFFERMTYANLANLSRESTEIAFLKPAMSRGVTIDADALAVLAEGSGGYPYLIQLAGRAAWPARGSERRITRDLAEHGVRVGRAKLEQLFASRWEKCTALERAFLYMVAQAGGTATTSAIASALGRSVNQVGPSRHKLVHVHHVLDPDGYGRVTIALPGLTAWILALGPVDVPVLKGTRR